MSRSVLQAITASCILAGAMACAGGRASAPASSDPEGPRSVAAVQDAGAAPDTAVIEGRPGTEAVAEPSVGVAAAASFESSVRPILERCAPCHFEGGKMYAKLPFDRPETIRELGARLFTRIKDPGEQAAIQAFLDQGPAAPTDQAAPRSR